MKIRLVYSEGVINFDLFCLLKIFEEGVLFRVSRWLSVSLFIFLFSAIVCCLVVFTV